MYLKVILIAARRNKAQLKDTLKAILVPSVKKLWMRSGSLLQASYMLVHST